VQVLYDDELVKSFKFAYKEGNFFKTLLDSVSEFRSGQYFYSHQFSYYDGQLGFHNAKTVAVEHYGTKVLSQLPNELIQLFGPLGQVLINSPLKTTTSTGWNAGGSIGLGLASTWQAFMQNKDFTFSGRAGYGETFSKDKISFQDMSGDGLPDVVYDKMFKGKGFYALQRDENGNFSLLPHKKIYYTGDLFESKSTSFNYGFGINISKIQLYSGLNWNQSASYTNSFLTDYNADGITDLVTPGSNTSIVNFGHFNDKGELFFSPSSEHTFNPVVRGVPVSKADDAQLLKDFEIVRTWEAPFEGTIKIGGKAGVLDSLQGTMKVAIQHNNQFIYGPQIVSPSQKINPDGTVYVSKGDLLLFRANCDVDGQQDMLAWDPSVSYQGSFPADPNGYSYDNSSYSESFLLSGGEGVPFIGDEYIAVDPNIGIAQPLTDDVVFNIRIDILDNNDGSLIRTDIYEMVVPAGDLGHLANFYEKNNPYSSPLFISTTPHQLNGTDSTQTCILSFDVFSTSNVRWEDIAWRPVVSFADSCGEVERHVYPTVRYQTYNRLEKLQDPNDLENLSPLDPGDSLRVMPIIDAQFSDYARIFGANPPSGLEHTAYLVTKHEGTLLGKLAITFNSAGTYTINRVMANGTPLTGLGPYYFEESDLSSQLLHAEIFAQSPKLVQFINDHVSLQLQNLTSGVNDNLPNWNLFVIDRNELQDKLLHWGHFAWSDTLSMSAIDTSALHLSMQQLAENNNADNINDPDQLDNLLLNNQDDLNPMKQSFFMLNAKRGEYETGLRTYMPDYNQQFNNTSSLDRYSVFGIHIASFSAKGVVSPGKMGEPEAVTPSGILLTPGMYGAFATSLNTKSKTLANSTTWGPVSLSATLPDKAKFFSESRTSFQDVNGDGYADILIYDNGFQAYLSKSTGGHTAKKFIHGSRFSKSTNETYGPVLNGRFINEGKGSDAVKSPKTGSVSADLGFSYNQAEFTDINGDGLPDRLVEDNSNQFLANFNTGENLLNPVVISTVVKKGQSLSFSNTIGGTPFLSEVRKLKNGKEKFARSFSVGVNITQTGSRSRRLLRDLNGDGLVDWIRQIGVANKFEIYINTGTSFQKYTNVVDVEKGINLSESLGFSGNAAGTFSFPIANFGFIALKMAISANASAHFSMNELKSSLIDADGDGVVDYVSSPDNGSLQISISKVGKANKLKTVHNPLKGSFTLNYKLEGSKFGKYPTKVKTHMTGPGDVTVWDMPNSKWVMSSLVIDDGLDVSNNGKDLDGVDITKVFFAYDGGIHSRREREFLGFTRIEKRYLFHEGDWPYPTAGTESYESKNPDAPALPFHFITEVIQYKAPVKNEPQYFKRFDYLGNQIKAQYTLYNRVFEIEQFISENNYYYHYPRLIKPISVQQYEYDYRTVNMNTELNAVAKNGQNWVAVDWNTITESDCVFPAVTATTTFSFPQVHDDAVDDMYYAMKYSIEYDEFFNVTQYANNGTQDEPVLDTVVVDTVYHTHFVYHTQEYLYGQMPRDTSWHLNLSSLCHVVPSDSASKGYQPDTLVIIYDPCSGTGYNDLTPMVTTHKKLVTDTIYIKELQDISVYSGALIAQMEYFPKGSAAQQTNMLRRHKIYQYNTDVSNLTRHSYVRSLTAGAKVPGEINQYLNNTQYAAVNLSYDTTYGNVIRIAAPANKHGQRLVSRFTYDNTLHKFVIGIGNSYGDSACTSYDFATENLLRSVDINGQPTQYVYDDMHRIKQIWAPRELSKPASPPTINFAYYPFDAVPVAITTHNMARNEMPANYTGTSISANWQSVSNRPTIADSMRTATFVNGIGQAVQIKKDAAKDSAVTIMTSGLAFVDHLARHVSTTVNKLSVGQAIRQFDDSPLQSLSDEVTEYDYMNRPLSVWNIGNGTTELSYSWIQDPQWGDVYVEGISNAIHMTIFKDSWGRDIRSRSTSYKEQYNSVTGGLNTVIDKELDTDFEFNPIGELLRSENPLDVPTSYTYDRFGRMVEEHHDDRGLTTMRYDMSGNVISIQNPATGSDSITFDYHYNRLIEKSMPQTDDLYGVQYTYGSFGDGKNGAGRIVQIDQGLQFKTDHYKYDELGNVVFEGKVFDLPSGVRNFITKYNYDSWGRVQDVTYPDNEVVKYYYKSTGELERINSRLNGQHHFEDIVRYADYDGYGNMNYLKYGNGAVTTFSYGANNQRLIATDLETRTSASSPGTKSLILNKFFGYDQYGRIVSVANTPLTSGTVAMGGSYANAYTYDAFNRLAETNATFTGAEGNLDYTLNMAYNDAGGIERKIMTSNTLSGKNRYDFNYIYHAEDSQSPHDGEHRLYRVTNKNTGPLAPPELTEFEHNASGSLKSIATASDSNSTPIITERYVRNEEQWLMGHEDVANSQVTHFVYDHTGERIMKGGLSNSSVAINGQGGPLSLNMTPYTIYVNPYYVTEEFNNGAVTSKHYYMGTQRVATQLAGLAEDREPADHPGDKPLEEDRMKQESKQNNPLLKNLQFVLADFGKEQGSDYQVEDLASVPEASDYYPDTLAPSMKTRGGGGNDAPFGIAERTMYYYHPDYLGNVEYITDADGLPYQYFWYSPWGETLTEHRAATTSWASPYRFNGKELDDETGLYYYGARYYNPQVSVWLSVDRLASKYPNSSPYVFTGNNPILYVDPNGDSLDVANQASFNDLLSLVSSKNRSRVTQINGRISVDISGLSKRQLRADKGLNLLYEISVAPEMLLYTKGELELFGSKNPNSGSFMHLVGLDKNGVINASKNGTDSRGGHEIMPRDGYDSQLAITAEGSWDMNGGGRKSIIFHELAEAFFRAQGINFGNAANPNDNGAHNMAIRLEGNHYGNRTPGGITNYKRPIYDATRSELMKHMILQYKKAPMFIFIPNK
jgi:RHS repeat-associated protein